MVYNSLEMLTNNGIIGFDAEAYVNGTSPKKTDAFVTPEAFGIKPGEKLNGGPSSDAFVSYEDNGINSPKGRLIAGSILGALLLALGLKVKSLFNVKYPKILRNRAGSEVAGKTAKKENIFKRAKDKITSWVKSDKTTEVVGKTKETTSKATGKVKEFLKKMPQWSKYTIAGAIGLLGLYGAYTMFDNKKEK